MILSGVHQNRNESTAIKQLNEVINTCQAQQKSRNAEDGLFVNKHELDEPKKVEFAGEMRIQRGMD